MKKIIVTICLMRMNVNNVPAPLYKHGKKETIDVITDCMTR